MVSNDVTGQIKPEFGHLCKDCTFLGNGIIQNDVEAADTVCCNEDQVFSNVINFSNFAFFDRGIFLHCVLLFGDVTC